MADPDNSSNSLARVRAAKMQLSRELAKTTGVVGIGIGRGGEGLVLQVNVASAKDAKGIPGSVDGVPVQVEVVGRIRPK